MKQYIEELQAIEMSIDYEKNQELLHTFDQGLKYRFKAEVCHGNPKILLEIARMYLHFDELLQPQKNFCSNQIKQGRK